MNKLLISREKLADIYLDWVTNYLTIELFAEHHGLFPKEAKRLIELGRDCFHIDHPEY